ncbi:MAG TPA: helix-turn-helix domain-containing protein [Solirubrobacterales bacterium]|nr:helix-turn-helix domain-containing protein [Solirubrobacterales bacterium]
MAAARTVPRRRLESGAEPEAMSPQQLVLVLNHRLRRDILRRLHDAGEARSPRELAALLGLDLADLAHHVAVLRAVGAVRPTDTIFESGVSEHFYASTLEADGGIGLVLVATERQDEGS